MKENSDDSSSKDDEESQLSRQFPDAFYCPITKDLFQNPVVVRDGDSYELSAVPRYNPSSLYPNRALREIIADYKETTGDDLPTSLRRIQKTMRNNFESLLDQSAFPPAFNPNYRGPLPGAYYCPITLDLMIDPVIDKDGQTYERRAIVKWIEANGRSPTSRKEASTEDLYPNNAIYDLIYDELQKSDASIHPSIRKWKTQYHNKQQTLSVRDQIIEENSNNANGVTEDNNGENNNEDDDDDSVLPLTEEEIDERRRRRKKFCTKLACWLALLVFFYFVPYAFVMFMFFFCTGCVMRLHAVNN